MSRRGLPFEVFLALRYLPARGHRTNLSLFAWMGGGATGGLVRGVDIASASVRKDLTRQIKMGSLEPLGRSGGEPAIILGRELARTLGVIPGESVTVISPQGALTAVGMVPKMRRFTVAGTFE